MTQAEKLTREDLLAKAKHELGSAANEFQRGLAALKDPVRQRQLTSAYVQIMQRYLAKAQHALDKYQDRNAPHDKPGTTDQRPQP